MPILVVEDNAISARIMEVNLRKGRDEAVVAGNGKQALEILGSTPGIQAIITDIMMPEMDGFELLRSIKASPEWREIPVIMCSSLGDVEHVKKACLLGCRHYLVKPIQPGMLLQKVSEALAGDTPVLRDRLEIMVRFGLDDQSYSEVSGAFSLLVKEQVKLLERQLERRGNERIALALASLSEGASVLGADRLIQLLASEFSTRNEGTGVKTWLPKYRLLLQELRLLAQVLPATT